jgi:hypothetical protein
MKFVIFIKNIYLDLDFILFHLYKIQITIFYLVSNIILLYFFL